MEERRESAKKENFFKYISYQKEKSYINSRKEKFLYLSTLRKNNVHLFYRLITDHLKVSKYPVIPLLYLHWAEHCYNGRN